MKKDLGIIFGLAFLIVVLLLFGKGFTSTSFLAPSSSQQSKKTEVKVTIKDLRLSARVASSATDRKKGLSKTESIPLDSGMVFVFDKADVYAIWMKDMKFAIDILWIGEDKTIVDIAENIPPEPGKADRELTVYKPKLPARYILEINAGISKLNNLQTGDKVDFTL